MSILVAIEDIYIFNMPKFLATLMLARTIYVLPIILHRLIVSFLYDVYLGSHIEKCTFYEIERWTRVIAVEYLGLLACLNI